MKQYAVFDWDNTVHEGFTLFRWIDFLRSKSEVSIELPGIIDRYTNLYQTGNITHDDYARFTWQAYEDDIKGKNEQIIDEYITDFISDGIDDGFYPFSEELFSYLHKKDIDIIIVSGAPYNILKRYVNRFHLNRIYAVEEECAGGTFTGKIISSAGYDKIKIINRLIKTYGKRPVLGFGDSDSDIPIFNNSRHAFQIVSQESGRRNLRFHNITTLPNSCTGDVAIHLVDRVLRRDYIRKRRVNTVANSDRNGTNAVYLGTTSAMVRGCRKHTSHYKMRKKKK